MNAIVLNTQREARPMSGSAPILTVENVRVSFGDMVAIDGISLSVRHGEFVSLIGPSGCGKSTLLKAIAGLVEPAAGGIALADPHLRIGFMFQKPLLLPWRTTLDNVLLPIELQSGGRPGPADRDKAHRMLELVQLADFAGAYPHQLSGGMQQRAALARTLVCDPDILLLDEPFGALDELTRDVLNEEMIGIWESGETRLSTVLMVTHSIPEAVAMSDRVVVLTPRPARLIEDVAIRELRPRHPENPDTAAITRHIRDLIRQSR